MTDEYWMRFFELRSKLHKAIRKERAKGEPGKLYEGEMEVHFLFGGESEPDETRVVIEAHTYLIGPHRHYEWRSRTFAVALQMAEADISEWIKQADEEVDEEE